MSAVSPSDAAARSDFTCIPPAAADASLPSVIPVTSASPSSRPEIEQIFYLKKESFGGKGENFATHSLSARSSVENPDAFIRFPGKVAFVPSL